MLLNSFGDWGGCSILQYGNAPSGSGIEIPPYTQTYPSGFDIENSLLKIDKLLITQNNNNTIGQGEPVAFKASIYNTVTKKFLLQSDLEYATANLFIVQQYSLTKDSWAPIANWTNVELDITRNFVESDTNWYKGDEVNYGFDDSEYNFLYIPSNFSGVLSLSGTYIMQIKLGIIDGAPVTFSYTITVN